MNKKFNKSTKKFNLRQSKEPIKIDSNSIPNTISQSAATEWIGNDKDPFYKIQRIDYPIKANGDIYTESFFSSFINSLADAPIPGSKDGHTTKWGARGKTDFIMSGAKLESKGDGTGSVYFKNYIPKDGNETFIKELKSNMIEFSLVAYVREERVDKGNGEIEYHVIEALSGLRNDAVDVGAMEQRLNAADSSDNNSKGENMEKKTEALQLLKNFKANGELTLLEVAKALGLENQVVTNEQLEAVQKLNAVTVLCGETDPVEFVSSLIEEKKQNAAEVRKAKLNEIFGSEKINGKENPVRIYAETLAGDDELTEEKVNEIKEDSIFKSLAAQIADVNSDFNKIGESEGGKDKKANSEVREDKV